MWTAAKAFVLQRPIKCLSESARQIGQDRICVALGKVGKPTFAKLWLIV
jgi:hypothetical protein